MAQYGEAANYYSGAPQQPQGAYHQGQPYGQQPPPPQQYGYGQQPPQYGQNYGPPQGPPPSQNYGPPQGPPPPTQQPHAMGQQQNGYQQMGYDDNKQGFEQQFKIDKPKYNDWWAGLLFIAVFLGYTAVSAIAIRGYSQSNTGGIYGNANQFALNSNTIILFAFIIGMATVFSYAYMWAARKFTKQFIWITGILSIVFGLVTAIYMLSRRYWSGGIVFLLFTIFHAFCFWSWIPRIPFSVLMLQTAIDVAKKYGHTYVVSLIGGILAAALAAWYSVTLVSVYAQFTPNGANSNCRNGVGDCGNGKVIGLIVFITFAMYWISEWLKNTIHTTISGVYGSWYFNPNAMPKGATRGAFKRSVTYSFGSISLGSLLVAIIQFLRQICSAAQRSASSDGNMVGAILFCILGCLIGLLEWAVEFLNRYAFSYIALYGKSYIAAAKDTWKMIKDRGIDALVNECLIGPVLSMGATFVGYSCALLAYLYLIFTSPGYNSDGSYTPVVVAFAFVMGLQICKIFTTPLSSGLDTIFVGMAWDPEVLMREHPDLYHRMVAVYPHVQQAIHA